MAQYRLLIAHELVMAADPAMRCWVPGDAEMEGEGSGMIVGDGTPYRVRWPTVHMVPLDAEARELIRREEQRIAANSGIEVESDDSYEDHYVPGSPGVRRGEPLPDG